MPINWNEVDKAKLEYIQQQEAAKARYEEELKIYKEKEKNSNFIIRLFNGLKKPEEPKYFYLSKCLYKNNNEEIIKICKDTIFIINLYKILSKNELDQIRAYLNIDKILKNIYHNNNCIETYYMKDTKENRKQVDKLIQFIEKRLEQNFLIAKKDYEKRQKEFKAKQKEAEVYIDNFINNKEN